MKDKVKYILELPIQEAEKQINEDCDIIGLKFTEDIEKGIEAFKKLLPCIDKPLMLIGSGDDEIDVQLLPELMKLLDRECIIGIANEKNYKQIVPDVIKGNHILTSDMGLPLDKILIDTDIGGLGYGFEYGYSIMEKIKLEGKSGDKYLNMPIISFATVETAKTKEAKDKDLALYLEITSAAAVKAAGADYIVLTNPQSYKTLKELER